MKTKQNNPEFQISPSLRMASFKFLDKQKFKKSELVEEYVSEKVEHFLENQDYQFMEITAIAIAKLYINSKTQNPKVMKKQQNTQTASNETATIVNTVKVATKKSKTSGESTVKATTETKTKRAVKGTIPDLSVRSYQELAKMYGNGFVGMSKTKLIEELNKRSSN